VGADVITIAQFDLSRNPYLEESARAGIRGRYGTLADRVTASAPRSARSRWTSPGTLLNDDPTIYSRTAGSANARSHAVAAAETIRQLGRADPNLPELTAKTQVAGLVRDGLVSRHVS